MSTYRTLMLVALTTLVNSASAQQANWIELAVHNFGAPINTMWAEGELSFADDGTMVYCSARQDMAVVDGDPKDLYIASFNPESGTWDTPVNMGTPVNQPPATDVDPLRLGDDREPWIAADGNTIYFRSDRLATTTPRNNHDLFVTRKVNGQWSTPSWSLSVSTRRVTNIARRCCKTVKHCVLPRVVPEATVGQTFTALNPTAEAAGGMQ